MRGARDTIFTLISSQENICYNIHTTCNQWRIQLVTRVGTCPPSILEKIYYPGIYPLKLSILHNFHSIFSLLSLRLSLWIFTVAPSSFSSSSSFVSSSSLPTRLTFDIFQAYKLSGNNPPTFILLQPRGSPYTILFTFCILLFLNVFCFIFFLFFN